ncbi:ATP-dependent dethiobiotin synthetase BioD [Pseudanabaena sp. FACHB-1998]|uniref:dethiobiotin synthase n=1 Tax=Pseudanabaena sp. FACHB-1998 TaxID=2692858 RepID=UPI0016811DE5|nr:dethiobiotin synthase [Pseudanabaena sp. FACHB-1998]MBD2176500.1 ATP-dependent dethiobiotin synthetase BioD [Pseudanabaena sp. FACHB-1998]
MIRLKPLLIVGSDTGVGKTVLTAALAAYWLTYRDRADLAQLSTSLGIYKPLQSGVGDREFYNQTFKLSQTLEEITPLYFETPIAPAIAAYKEDKPIDLAIIWQQFLKLQQQKDCLLVEAMGGLGSPITDEYIVADLARDWALEAILVVPVRLGAISQAIANVALANLQKVKLRGIVLSCSQEYSSEEIEELAPPQMISRLTSVPVLGILPYISDFQDIKLLARAASELDIERIF